MLPPLVEGDVMLSLLDCQEFPLELMRKLTAAEDEEDEEYRDWLACEPIEEEEEENEFEKVDDELAPSDLCLWD